jgi:pimeloyl-ACP methyl ester carboxylesterase
MGKQASFAVIVLLAVWLMLAVGSCRPWRSYEAAMVLTDVAVGDGPSRLKRTTQEPQRIAVCYRTEGRPGQGDLYRPAEEIRAALLLVPGVAETGKDDPRLVAFATTLARVGFAVLVPDLPRLRKLQVSPADVGELVDAFAWLAANPQLAPQGRAGMAAFSYAAGPTLLASLEEAIRQRVQFVFAVGAYYDLQQVLTFSTTGYYRQNERWHYLQSNEYGTWAFVASNIHRLGHAEDRLIFGQMTRRKLADLTAPIDDLVAGLGKEGQALHAFISNRDPRRVAQLMKALPVALRQDIAALNLAGKDLSRLSARLILVHGLHDRMIPYVESVALAKAVPEGQSHLFLVKGLEHVDVAPELPDRWRLWRAVSLLLAARDGRL